MNHYGGNCDFFTIVFSACGLCAASSESAFSRWLAAFARRAPAAAAKER